MSLSTGGAATGMPSLPEVWSWEQQLVGFGTRYTGSSGHVAYVDWLAEQFSAIPGFSTKTDRLTFNRWLARDFALTVSVPATVGRSGAIPLTYYYPYSGQTTADGVAGNLVDLGVYPPATPASGLTEAFWAPARGGIAWCGPRRRCSRWMRARRRSAATSRARPPLRPPWTTPLTLPR